MFKMFVAFNSLLNIYTNKYLKKHILIDLYVKVAAEFFVKIVKCDNTREEKQILKNKPGFQSRYCDKTGCLKSIRSQIFVHNYY